MSILFSWEIGQSAFPGAGGTLCSKAGLGGVWLWHKALLSTQVPYETLNKRFRAAQKNIDRETSHVTMVVAELEKTLGSCPAVDSVVSLLDGVVEKLSVLKRKVGATELWWWAGGLCT